MRGGQSDARGFKHGDVHGVDKLVERLAAQLPLIGCGLLAQHRFAGLHDRQQFVLAAGFDEFLDLAVELEIHFCITSKHVFSVVLVPGTLPPPSPCAMMPCRSMAFPSSEIVRG